MQSPLHILAVTNKPGSASYEQRILNWIEPLAAQGVHVNTQVWPARTRLDPLGINRRQAIRRLLREAGQADAVWWHRNLLREPVAQQVRAAARCWVIDYDDPLCYSSKNGGQPSATRAGRFAATVGRVDAVLTASLYLADLAGQYQKPEDVHIVPMAVDLPESVVPHEPKTSGPLTLLWLGSRSTQRYLMAIAEVFAALPFDFTLRIVGGDAVELPGVKVDCRAWSHEEQGLALREADIGLCPMPDTLWTRGKCPYKVLQYMSYSLPWVGSAVGENLTMATDAQAPRGLVADSTTAWVKALTQFAGDAALRQRMGDNGRDYVERVHSRTALAARLTHFWRKVTAPAVY